MDDGLNQALCNILGYTEKELLKMSFQSLTHSDDLSGNLELARKLINGEIAYLQVEKRYRHKRDHYVWCRLTSSVVRTDTGKSEFYVSQIEDITEQKQARDILTERAKVNAWLSRMQQVFEHTTDGMFFTDVLDNGRFNIVEINPAFKTMSGITEKQINLPLDERLDSGDGSILLMVGKYREVVATKKMVEYEIMFKNDITHIRLIPVLNDIGDVVHVIGISTDITRQKKYEEELFKREQEFRTLVENSPDIITRFDLNLNRVYANPAYQKLTGFSPEATRSLDTSQTPLQTHIAQTIKKMLQKVLDTALPNETDLEWNNASGEYKCYHLRAIPEFDKEGCVTSVLTIARDVSERKNSEKLLAMREQEFRTLVENSQDVIIRYNKKCQRVYVNPAYLELSGFSPEEAIGVTPFQGSPLPKAMADELQTLVKQTLSSGKPGEMDMEWTDNNGLFHCYHTHVTPEFDENKTVISALIVGHDIRDRRKAEKLLALREQEIRALVESSPGQIGSFYRRSDGSVCMPYVSPNIWEHFGLRPEDVVNDATPLLARTHPDDAKRLTQTIAKSARTMTTWHEEYRVLHPEKGVLWMESNTNPKLHPDGGIIWYGYIHNITERKKAEKLIVQREQEYRSLIENSPDNIIRYNSKGIAIYSNQPNIGELSTKLLGKSPIELITPDMPELIAREYKQYNDVLLKVIATGRKQSVEMHVPQPDGSLRFHNILFAPEKDDEGNVTGAIAFGRDITERVRHEKEIAEKNYKLAEAQRIGRLGLWELNFTNGQITFTSELNRIYELSSDRTASTYDRFLQVVHPEDRKLIDKIYQDSLANTGNETTHSFEHRLLFRDGRVKYVYQHWENIFDTSGKPVLTRGTIQNITFRKETELELIEAKKKAEESNLIKSAFLANMNHEFRTPLNHILGFSDLLKKEESSVVSEYANFIHKSGKQLLEILEDIIKLSLTEQLDITPKNKPVIIKGLFLGCQKILTEMLEFSGKNNCIKLVFNPDTKLLSTIVITDINKINLVLGNLFKNAVKFTGKGSIEFGLYSDNPGWITLYIKDTGIGIPSENFEFIFEIFRKGDDSSTELYGGIGIGLAISKRITDLLKGTLRVESEVDKGSIFYLDIPVNVNKVSQNDE